MFCPIQFADHYDGLNKAELNLHVQKLKGAFEGSSSQYSDRVTRICIHKVCTVLMSQPTQPAL